MFTEEDPFYTFLQFKEKLKPTSDFFKWSDEVKFYAEQQCFAGKLLIFFKHQIKSYQEVLDILSEKFSPYKHQSKIMSCFWEFSLLP